MIGSQCNHSTVLGKLRQNNNALCYKCMFVSQMDCFPFPQGQWFATIVSREAGICSNLSCFRTNNKLKCKESWNICDKMVLLTLKDRGRLPAPHPIVMSLVLSILMSLTEWTLPTFTCAELLYMTHHQGGQDIPSLVRSSWYHVSCMLTVLWGVHYRAWGGGCSGQGK